ncbi:YcxB family protein [Nostoc sp. FACHB-152]|uniref:YcxB family protein n=1 Tax=unclassified Nostoc TaxID=2593658 RepID=UPI0016821A93|nr:MULTISPECIES: YcxB family protein [unclassified Nostoc]MBD2450979.1 YcxB family protein [Nostoc sp. FACHB-152]MBD2467183.1 YcxB family protein [Nostoc sp. FACHB-145]
MQIKTKTFQTTPKELRAVLTVEYYRRIKRNFIVLSILATMSIIFSILQNRFDWWAVYFLGILAYTASAPLFFRVQKQTSALNFQARHCEIDENFFGLYYADGSIIKMTYEQFIEVRKKADYYFLYMSKTQFHYLPIAAFETEKDIHRFDLWLQSKQLIKLW